jgi:hypothetical protein
MFMKATYFLPAHPSYFGDEYTQEEIEAAYTVYNQQMRGIIFKGTDNPLLVQEFKLLREPGNNPQVIVENVGLPGVELPKPEKQLLREHAKTLSERWLRLHIEYLGYALKRNRLEAEGILNPRTEDEFCSYYRMGRMPSDD